MKRDRFMQFIEGIKAMRDDVNDDQALNAKDIYPEWKSDTLYKVGNRILYDGILYTCLQAHTSQSDWTPDITAALWAKVLIPNENEVPEWEQPNSTNPYKTGDRVMYAGYIWESTIDNNVWEPGIYGWVQIEV